jgi:uncharacterized membrane protein
VTAIENEGRDHQRELDRIAAFSDAVIAVAITLLVLKLDVPRLTGDQVSELDEKLLDLWPDFLAYALSFVVIGRYWFVHHRFFAVLDRWDARLVALNIGFLAFLVLIPFATDLVGEYGDQKAAPITYGAVLTMTGLANWLITRHALRQHLVQPRRAEAAGVGAAAVGLPVVFAASVPIAFVSPFAAEALWALGALVRPRWWSRRRP